MWLGHPIVQREGGQSAGGAGTTAGSNSQIFGGERSPEEACVPGAAAEPLSRAAGSVAEETGRAGGSHLSKCHSGPEDKEVHQEAVREDPPQ